MAWRRTWGLYCYSWPEGCLLRVALRAKDSRHQQPRPVRPWSKHQPPCSAAHIRPCNTSYNIIPTSVPPRKASCRARLAPLQAWASRESGFYTPNSSLVSACRTDNESAQPPYLVHGVALPYHLPGVLREFLHVSVQLAIPTDPCLCLFSNGASHIHPHWD